MSRSIIKVEAKDCKQYENILHDNGDVETRLVLEYQCEYCSEEDVDLYGFEHSGYFRGVCKKCLNKIFALSEDSE